jgi:hypothetical protein
MIASFAEKGLTACPDSRDPIDEVARMTPEAGAFDTVRDGWISGRPERFRRVRADQMQFMKRAGGLLCNPLTDKTLDRAVLRRT